MTRPRRRRQLPTVQVADLVVPTRSISPEAIAERKRQALYGYAQGKTTVQIARDIGVNRKTIYQWARTDTDFFEQKERILAAREDALAEEDAILADEMEDIIVELARGNTTKDGVPHFPAALAVAKVANPARWGDKKTVEHTGAVVHTLIPQAKRLDELPFAPDIIDIPQVESGDEDE